MNHRSLRHQLHQIYRVGVQGIGGRHNVPKSVRRRLRALKLLTRSDRVTKFGHACYVCAHPLRSTMTDDEFQAELKRRGLAVAAKPATPVPATPPPTPAVNRSPMPAPVPASRPNVAPPVIGAVPPVVLPRPAQALQPVVLGAVPTMPASTGDTEPIDYAVGDPPFTGCPHCGEESCPHERPECDFDASCDARVNTKFRGKVYCAGHARIVWRSITEEDRDEWTASVAPPAEEETQIVSFVDRGDAFGEDPVDPVENALLGLTDEQLAAELRRRGVEP